VTAAADIDALEAGDTLAEREFCMGTVQLFLYNAALWNADRIHFDHPHATLVESHPALVVPGPLLGDWLAQCVIEWLGDAGRLESFEYANRRACYLGDVLRSRGRVVSVDRDSGKAAIGLEIVNQAGNVTTSGTAVARFVRA
jgi:3-methylfumaryl-CoA hydratase